MKFVAILPRPCISTRSLPSDITIGIYPRESPLDGNFGIITVMAGIWISIIFFLKDASISRNMYNPLAPTTYTKDVSFVEYEGKLIPQVEYGISGFKGYRQTSTFCDIDKPFELKTWLGRNLLTFLTECQRSLTWTAHI